uniref:DoxX family membrane protein n=1 Tax=Cellulomonas sp. HZM TaxID=1454010 RepID=UPI001E5AE1A8
AWGGSGIARSSSREGVPVLLRRIARPMFASWFVGQGLDAVRHPAAHAADARGAIDLVRRRTSLDVSVSDRTLTTAVQAHGVAVAAAGVLLAVGKAPRTAALALAALTAPLVVVNLPDKAADEGSVELRRARRERLVRSVAFVGGALIAGVDLEGRPGMGWRISHARAQHAAAHE